MGFHDPVDTDDLIGPMSELAVRYEDHPDDRVGIGEEIGAVVAAYLGRAPWPLD